MTASSSPELRTTGRSAPVVSSGAAAPRRPARRRPSARARDDGASAKPAQPPRPPDGWALGPRGRIAVFWALIAAAVVFLFVVRGIVAPFLWALILAYLLNPVVKLVCRYLRVPRIVAVTIIYVALGSAIAWLWVTTSPLLLGQIQDLGEALPGLVDQIVALLASTDSIMVLGFKIDIEPLVAEIGPAANELVTEATRRLLETAVEALEIVLHFLLTVVATFYLLIDLNRLGAFARRQIPARFRTEFGPLVQRIDRIVVRFIYGELALVVIMSTVTYIALTILDVRFALVLAIATGFLELIPYIGPITAGGLAVLVSFGQTPPFGWTPVVYGAVITFVYFVLRHAEDYFVIPNVVGRAVKLHPVLTMFAIFSGAVLGGIMGMLLAVPIAAILRLIVQFMWRKVVEAEKF